MLISVDTLYHHQNDGETRQFEEGVCASVITVGNVQASATPPELLQRAVAPVHVSYCCGCQEYSWSSGSVRCYGACARSVAKFWELLFLQRYV